MAEQTAYSRKLPNARLPRKYNQDRSKSNSIGAAGKREPEGWQESKKLILGPSKAQHLSTSPLQMDMSTSCLSCFPTVPISTWRTSMA